MKELLSKNNYFDFKKTLIIGFVYYKTTIWRQLYGYPFLQFWQGQIEPLPDRFEKPEPVHRFTGQIFLGITRLTLTGPQPYTYANILVIY